MGATKHNFIFPYTLVIFDKKILPCALKIADLPLPAAPPFLPVIFLNIGAFCWQIEFFLNRYNMKPKTNNTNVCNLCIYVLQTFIVYFFL